MKEGDAYTSSQWAHAVKLSGLLGWLAIAVPITSRTDGGSLVNFLGLMIWAAVLGLPVAWLASRLITGPVLKRILRKPLSWMRAGLWGAVISSLFALIGIAITRLWKWYWSIDPGSYAQTDSGNWAQQADRILAISSWMLPAKSTVLFVVAGVFIALIVRAFIGPGNRTDP